MPASSPAKILAIGDVHLGTRCSGLPENAYEWGVETSDFTPASALTTAVDFALREEVDGVIFAGDVVDSTNARFEALQSLKPNIERLLNANIDVVAVAGNHDVEALPRISNIYNKFTLLGAGGQWQSHVISRGNEPLAEILGWSFGERQINFSPVAQLLADPLSPSVTNIPRIGLLHANLGASGGNYAPIKQSELDQTGLDSWLLGHIHKPSLTNWPQTNGPQTNEPQTSAKYPSGYLGSLVGLDASETGPHGPWLITIPGNNEILIEHHPIAPLRWEYLNVSIGEITDIENFADLLLSEAKQKYHEIERSGFVPKALGLRVIVEGTSPIYEEIETYIEQRRWGQVMTTVDDCFLFINRVINRMGPYIEADKIAKGDHPAAIMARRILCLEQNNDEAKDLVKDIQSGLQSLANDSRWQPLKERRDAVDPIDDEALRLTLLQAAKSALSAMITQGEVVNESS